MKRKANEYIILSSHQSEMFPLIESFDDYHEVGVRLKDLKLHYQGDGYVIMGKEVAFDGLYWALFWIKGYKPEKKELLEMLRDAGYESKGVYSEVYV